MKTRLRQNDNVIVIAGADRGKTGTVLKLDKAAGKALVEGINMKWKHMRRSQENPQGGRMQREYPIQMSNLAYLDSESGKGVRLGYEIVDGKKVRVMRPSGKRID